MNAEEEVVTLQDVNNNINNLGQQVTELRNEILHDQTLVNAHPVLFIMLMVAFFVTMDFWAAAAHSTLNAIHPRGYITWWEYIIFAVIGLVVLVWLANISGIKVQRLGE